MISVSTEPSTHSRLVSVGTQTEAPTLSSTGTMTDVPQFVSCETQTFVPEVASVGTQATTTTDQPVESTTPTAVKLDELAEELNASHDMRAPLSQCIWNGRVSLHCKGNLFPQVHNECSKISHLNEFTLVGAWLQQVVGQVLQCAVFSC